MIQLALASLWHWSQRDDCTPLNLSAGYWQASRVYALLGRAQNAGRYGQLALEASQQGEPAPFYTDYAYEGLARAAAVAGDREQTEAYLALARQSAGQIADPEERNWLLADLKTIYLP